MSVLVLGGSQGAKALNETVPRAVAACRDQGVPLQVVHQTGRDKEGEVHELYRELGLAECAEVVPFIDDVAGALARTEVFVGRAGASSLAELCAVGRPGILIPYPYAADDHQRKNAESLERAGAARCVVQAEANADRLAVELATLGRDAGLRRRMAERSAERGRSDAAREVARDLLRLADGRPRAHDAVGQSGEDRPEQDRSSIQRRRSGAAVGTVPVSSVEGRHAAMAATEVLP
jgi:UDP-N-acetylglucosamine--N-acetylmuramyl-(pentapeptide) pyrophosphoryl-undecaprenol N-acetylglucosamine transferase